MARGGKREGAGRPKGSGISPKKAAQIEAAMIVAAEGMTPLEYMLNVMRTSDDPKRKDAMACAAAPYIHPRLASTNVTMDDKRTTADITTAELIAQLEADRNPPRSSEEEASHREPDQIH